MSAQRDLPAEAGAEADAIRMADLTANEGADIGELHGKEMLDPDDWEPRRGVNPVVVALVAAGVAAVAVVGLKIAYDRRKSASVYRRALDQLEDARDALISAASELPERGREVLHKVARH